MEQDGLPVAIVIHVIENCYMVEIDSKVCV